MALEKPLDKILHLVIFQKKMLVPLNIFWSKTGNWKILLTLIFQKKKPKLSEMQLRPVGIFG